MKVDAYLCDHCGKLFKSDEVVGVSTVEDMFDRLSSYPVVYNPTKTEVHVAVACWKDAVARPAANMVDRRKDERGYELKMKELAYGLKAQSVKNHFDRKRNKKS